MRNFLKTIFLSLLIPIFIHSLSFAQTGFTGVGMEMFNPKNPFKKPFAPLKDKATVYYYLDYNSAFKGNYKQTVLPKLEERVAFVNDYVVFLNDHNKEIVKDLDQNLKFVGSKVDILIVHPLRYVPSDDDGPWGAFKTDPYYQSGDPKDFVELISAPGKTPIKDEMKLLVEEKINQLKKNDNLKKFFNNKPMNIKALNERVNGKYLTSSFDENNDGECSIYLKEKFANNIP